MYNNLANTQFTGKSIAFLPSCHSTNQIALERIKSGESSNGLIIITNNQTAGRGQRGNTWLSEAGANLTFSVIYHPEALDVRRSFYLNIVSSLAVAETLGYFLHEKQIRVKWPNDVYCENKKISGILIENSIRQHFLSSIVIGIGLNVNQHMSELHTASSMSQESGKDFNLESVFITLIEQLERYYMMLQNGQYNELFLQYTSGLYWLNEQRPFRDHKGEFSGTIKGITEEGQLIIDKKEGGLQHYAFKEIEFIHSAL